MGNITGEDLVRAAAFMGAGTAAGLGAIGPGVCEGCIGGKACEVIGRNPDEAGLLARTMLVVREVAESTGISSLAAALLLIFIV